VRVARYAAGLLAAALVLAVTGCSGENGDDVDPAQATAQLEKQRDDVRAATSELQRSAAKALGGTVTSSSGQWRGCESGGLEEYKNFRYLAGARIDVGGGDRPYLDRLQAVFEETGFGALEPGERPGGRTLHAERQDVAASFSELPDQGDYVLLSVAGPCIDVPDDEREDWLTRDEPTPDIT
jgi:hypothetical protein